MNQFSDTFTVKNDYDFNGKKKKRHSKNLLNG